MKLSLNSKSHELKSLPDQTKALKYTHIRIGKLVELRKIEEGD